ncbi:hypothetical protein GIB67_037722 [Kingdonia uniflora]|uniref:KIB1-4 beta-propeller domain-containing protein n=1 Tax=Kingdonia uniflora TaxID=39325 RepID=A0A7J7LV57_9MAGN|nr:hypothetical protein GIB67_037722 [Kingdonia uniflora]
MSPTISLFNPISGSQINLPPMTTIPEVVDFRPSIVGKEYLYRLYTGSVKPRSSSFLRNVMRKVVLSTSPTDDNCIAMAIQGDISTLAFCRLGDKRWTVFGDDEDGYRRGYRDIIFFKGKFYTISADRKVQVCDLGASPSIITIKPPTIVGMGVCNQVYLVEMCGQLLMVARHLHTPPPDIHKDRLNYYLTNVFEVFRLRLKQGKQRWAKVDSLGDYMLFLGRNQSFSLPAREYPGSKANCIYFTDDYSDHPNLVKIGGHDMGVFDMETGRTKLLPCYPNKTWLLLPEPLWFTPSQN